MSRLTLGAIAKQIGATLKGDPEYLVTGLATLISAMPNQVSFLANMKYRQQLSNCQAGAVILQPEHAKFYTGNCLLLDNPYVGFAKLSQAFDYKPQLCGIVKTARIDPTAVLGRGVNLAPGVFIGPNVTLGNCVSVGANTVVEAHAKVGDYTKIAANVTLYHRVKIGAQCIIHSGAVIGADGFGFAKDGCNWIKVAQLASVSIGDNVEIGAGTTIDRGTLTDTIIGNGVKLDNQIQIGHNVQLGDCTAIAACTGIAGSTTLGKYCTIAGACGVAGHLTLADNVHITAMSLVTHSIPKPGVYSSGTAMDKNHKWLRNATRFKQLEQMAKRIKHLELEIARLNCKQV
ncbi:MAG: UDP-3-O-(3-hydroxymyristoyl)glucosamine N-acyltransferase [Porticoccaceae bacterium]